MTHSKETLLLGIEIGGSKLQLLAGTSPEQIVRRKRLVADRDAGALAIRAQIEEALGEWGDARWRAAGIGFGGPVDWREGRVCCSHQVQGWAGLDFQSWLGRLLGVPVFVENDANLAALAEARYGAGRELNPVFYTNSGSGVGGGLVVEGQIYHGASPGEAEFGHLRLAVDAGTVEEHCSGWAIDRKIRQWAESDAPGELARLAKADPGSEARHLLRGLKSGDPAAQEILDEAAEKLAFGLSHVVHLFHPEVIVLGGGLSLMGESWRSAVLAALPKHLMGAFQSGLEVRLATLGEDVVPIGALALAESPHNGAERVHVIGNCRPAAEPTTSERWIHNYLKQQCETLAALPVERIASLLDMIRSAGKHKSEIFVIGNGGNAASACHFATDLGKGASDHGPERFRVRALTDNGAWVTALGNDYSFADVFVRQLMNFAEAGDLLIASSVSGSSTNVLKAVEWANAHGLVTVALVGAGRGELARAARHSIVIEENHYGRVEDAQMVIFHLLAYALMEAPREELKDPILFAELKP